MLCPPRPRPCFPTRTRAGHYRAASDFIAANFGADTPITVFHWRSEHVDEDMLEPCAVQLAELLDTIKWPTTPTGARGLLLSDMAAPNHQHILVRAPCARARWKGRGGGGGGGLAPTCSLPRPAPRLLSLSAAARPFARTPVNPPAPCSGTRTWAPSSSTRTAPCAP